jgi:VanZ family protein
VGVVYAVYDTISPLVARPLINTYVHFEHILAFAVVGALFCLAYPRSTVLVCCVIFGSAVLLEGLQTLTPDRHGTIFDALEKLAGGAIGIVIGKIVLALNRQRSASAKRS